MADELTSQTFTPGVAEAGGALPEPVEPGAAPVEGYGLSPEPAEEVGYGFDPQGGTPLPPPPPTRIDEQIAIHEAATGEDAAQLKVELSMQGPYLAIERGYGLHYNRRRQELEQLGENAAQIGDAEFASAVAATLRENDRNFAQNLASLYDKRRVVVEDAIVNTTAPLSSKNFRTDAQYHSEAEYEAALKARGDETDQQIENWKAEHKPSILGYAGQFAEELITFGFGTKAVVLKFAHDLTGKTYLDEHAASNDLRDLFLSSSPEVQAEILRRASGIGWTDAQRQEVVRRLEEGESRGQGYARGFFDVLNLTGAGLLVRDGVKLARGMSSVGKTLARTGGPELAGRAVAEDLKAGTAKTGLASDAQASSAIAVKSPYALDPDSVEGVSVPLLDALKSDAQKLRSEIDSRLRATGRMSEDDARRLAELETAYSPSNNPSIFDVRIGTITDAGTELRLTRQASEGVPFRSQEAALADAKARGIVNPELVPQRTVARVAVEEEIARVPAGKPRIFPKTTREAPAVEAVASPAAPGKFTLPPELAGAKPRFGVNEVQFANDLDKAAYIVANTKIASKAESAYLAAIRKQTGMTDAQIRALGQMVKARVKASGGIRADIGPPDKRAFGAEFAKIERAIAQRRKAGTSPDTDQLILDRITTARQYAAQGDWANFYRTTDSIGIDVQGARSAKATAIDAVLTGFPKRQRWSKSAGVTDAQATMWNGILEKLGMENQLVHYTTFREGANLEHGILAYESRATGLYLPPEPDRPFHTILLNPRLATGAKGLATAVHEPGHMFWNLFVAAPQFAQRRAQIQRAWEAFKLAHPDLADRYLHTKQAADLVKRGRTTGDAGFANPGGTLKLDVPSPTFFTDNVVKQWLDGIGAPEEWFVENLAKALFAEPRTLSVIEQAFKPIADLLRQMYAVVAKALGHDVSAAHPFVTSLLREHLKDVEAGRIRPRIAFAREEVTMRPDIAPEHAPPTTGTEGWVYRHSLTVPNSYSSIGKFTQADIDSMASTLIPNAILDPQRAASLFAVNERKIAVHAEDRLRTAFAKYIETAWKPLSRGSRQKVVNVLVEGDAYSNLSGKVGKEFDGFELTAKGLTDPEQRAYFAMRQVRNMTHNLRDSEMVRELVATGHHDLTFSVVSRDGVGSTITVPARPMDARTPHLMGKYIWDARENRGRIVRSETADQLIADRAHVRMLRTPQEINGKWFSHVIVDERSGQLRDLTSVLPYRPGEFSRIYTDEYFAIAQRAGQLDGTATSFASVARTATSLAEVQAYTKSMNAAVEYMRSIADGTLAVRNPEVHLEQLIGSHTSVSRFIEEFNAGKFDGVTFSHKYNRTKDDYLNDFTGWAVDERPFYGERGGRIYSVDPTRENTLDPLRSLQAEITNVSRVVNIGEWRGSLIQRWMNTFGDLIPGRTGNDVADFYRMAGVQFTERNRDTIFAERTHNYMMQQLGMRTEEEARYAGFMRTLTEKVLNVESPGAVNAVGAALRQANFGDMLRATTFDLTLGMYNPAQLIVQANGMATAASLHPLYGLASAKTYPLLRLALMSDRTDVWRAVGGIQKLSDLGLSSTEEFVKLTGAIRKTGIIENLRSTAYYTREDGALEFTGGIWNSFRKGGRWFFNRGEEASRIISFDVARREFIAANPGIEWTSDAALKSILVRTDDFTLNMTRANKAAWQTGAKAIPTQFLQYNLKLAATVASALKTGAERAVGKPTPYRSFTATEAAKLMAGHVVLYGAAGYGAYDLMAEVLGDRNVNAMTPMQKQYATQGLLGGLFATLTESLTGEASMVAIGTRLASFNYYVELGKALMHPADHNIWQALLGPTYNAISRVGTLNEVVKLWQVGRYTAPEAILKGAQRLTAEEIASLRNATRAYLYYSNLGVMTDNRMSKPVAQLTNPEILATAIGFQPSAALDTYQMQADRADINESLREIANLVNKHQYQAMLAAKRGDMKAYNEELDTIALFLSNMPIGDAMQVEQMLKDTIFPADTKFHKLLGEYVMDYYRPDRTRPIITTAPAGSLTDYTPEAPNGR